MPTILNEAQAAEWISPNLSEAKIMELAANLIGANQLSAYTLDKSFRTAPNPMEAFEYNELPNLTAL